LGVIRREFFCLCDGQGIVRAVEPFPKLKISPHWEEELEDWRPKLHQTVTRKVRGDEAQRFDIDGVADGHKHFGQL
jgi:hypothetical protein